MDMGNGVISPVANLLNASVVVVVVVVAVAAAAAADNDDDDVADAELN